ncbi:unnamed protein product [Rotaria sp. Silwood1]|nr:unnamed protein product [Rotaria sp. Silwood1]CAF1099197.1 unnamed protein product [Rotaria sp. Silwood1]CAF3424661.1 unnamed protein product [Rotaria sp. Silwood1]CAF3469469.1 unnamed protein product [Rotaria sp. Silwood1]CAF4634732.1 unnamed protein product [Rotaria sp. Silwood1]
MADANSSKDQATTDRNSANSINKLIIDNYNNKKRFSDDQSFDDDQTSVEKDQENFQKLKKSESSLPQSPADRPSYRGPFGITIDSSKEREIKLYGISGAGTLAIITFIIVFLDCCNDGNKKSHEQEALYRIIKEKEAREKAFVLRRSRRIAEGKEEKPKPFIIQHQRPKNVANSSHPQPHPHPYYHLNPHHTHHFQAFPPTSYHHPFVCPVCHDLHASGNARHNISDVGVDTSDKFDPVAKSKKVIHKSTRDAQTEPKLWDTERGTQTDRVEGTQTSAMELSGMPSNVTQIIHETTILKAPRSLINTLKTSMAQQDKDIAINRAVTDTNSMRPTNI